MWIVRFLKLVEIHTKVASMIPFAIGSVYAVYRFDQFSWFHFALMLISLLSFDMATTAINNYIDYKKALKTTGYGYEEHNGIVKYRMKEGTVLAIIFTLLLVAVTAGFTLFLEVGWIILVLGAMSFGIGILYSFGPIPISRMPLGEFFSGLFMGFVIILISTIIHVEEPGILAISAQDGMLLLQVNIKEFLLLFLVSIPAILGIANIMLANNICDVEEDLANKRYTLPVYIGVPKALTLFRVMYYVAYLDVIFFLFLGVHPLILAMILLSMILVSKNIGRFITDPSKERTFPLAVQNFILINVVWLLALALSIFF